MSANQLETTTLCLFQFFFIQGKCTIFDQIIVSFMEKLMAMLSLIEMQV